MVFIAILCLGAGPQPTRLTYQDTCLLLQKRGILDRGTIPPIPKRLPRHDDLEPLGINFFRTKLQSVYLDNLTLQRTFFSRSEIYRVSFKNSDLSESNLCWNDFMDVNFEFSVLKNSDLRSSTFVRVNFDHSNLGGADLRRSSFKKCTFRGANLTGAIATYSQQSQLGLSKVQIAQIAWTKNQGQEPNGG